MNTDPLTPAAGDRPVTPESDRAFAEWWRTTGLKAVAFGRPPEPGPRVGHPAECQEAWHAAVAWATARERERAAKIAESRILVYVIEASEMGFRRACCEIAAAIRSDPDAASLPTEE